MPVIPDRTSLETIFAQAFEQAGSNRELYEHLIRSDGQVKGLSPLVITIVMQLAWIFFEWWLLTSTNHPTLETAPKLAEELETRVQNILAFPAGEDSELE